MFSHIYLKILKDYPFNEIMIRISRAKPSDSEEVRKLETKVWNEEVSNKYDIPMFIRFGYAFIAKDRKKIIGCIYGYKTNKNQVFVCDWFVDKNYRKKDIGIKLYKKLISSISCPIVSFIDPKRIPTLNAHKKLGFKVLKKVKNAYGRAEGLEKGYKLLMGFKNNKK